MHGFLCRRVVNTAEVLWAAPVNVMLFFINAENVPKLVLGQFEHFCVYKFFSVKCSVEILEEPVAQDNAMQVDHPPQQYIHAGHTQKHKPL